MTANNQVTEASVKYLAEAAGQVVPVGYKQTEVGVIPEDWDIASVDECAIKVGSGKTPTGGSSVYRDSGRPFIRSQNVDWGKLELSEVAYITEEIHSTFTSTEIYEDDVLLNITGASIGRCAKSDWRIVGGNVNQHVCIIRTKPNKLNPNLLVELINSRIGQNQIDSYQAGGNREGLNFSQVRNLKFAIAQKTEEQTAIANALSDVDALINELEKLITKKQAIKTATMQQLLTGRIRLPQFVLREDGTQKGYKQTELGEIPENWEVVELGSLLDYEQPTKYLVNHSKYLQEGSFPVLTAGKSFILGYTEELNNVFIDLPVIIFDDFTTDSKYVDFPFKVKSSAMKMLKSKNAVQPLSLIFSLLQNLDFQVGDHKRHWISEFQFLKIALSTDSKEQTAMATILSDMDAEIQTLQQRLSKTRQIKQGMMQELLTGRIRLVSGE